MKVQYTQDENGLIDQAQPGKRKNKRRFLLLKSLLVLMLLTTAAVTIGLSPVCTIKSITVEGNKHYQAEDISGLVNIMTGSSAVRTLAVDPANLFTLRYINEEQNILRTLPFIKDVKVRYVLPDRVVISVTEREAAGIITNNGINLLVDQTGYVLDILGKTPGVNVPVIEGINFDRYELGQALKPANKKGMDGAFGLMEAIVKSDNSSEFKLYPLVNRISIGADGNISFLVDGRLIVLVGKMKEIDYKLRFFKQIYTKNLSSEDKGTVDFSTGNNPSFKPGTR